jgi:hypothetical protein
MKKYKQHEELYREILNENGNPSFPEMYLKEKLRRKDIEKRYDILVSLLKDEGCTRVSQRISDELKAQKRLH